VFAGGAGFARGGRQTRTGDARFISREFGVPLIASVCLVVTDSRRLAESSNTGTHRPHRQRTQVANSRDGSNPFAFSECEDSLSAERASKRLILIKRTWIAYADRASPPGFRRNARRERGRVRTGEQEETERRIAARPSTREGPVYYYSATAHAQIDLLVSQLAIRFQRAQRWIPRSARGLSLSPSLSPNGFQRGPRSGPYLIVFRGGPPPRAAGTSLVEPSSARARCNATGGFLQRGLRERSSIKIAVYSPRRAPSIVACFANTAAPLLPCFLLLAFDPVVIVLLVPVASLEPAVLIEYDLRTGPTTRDGYSRSSPRASLAIRLSRLRSWQIDR